MNTESEVLGADGLVPYTNHYGPYEQSVGSSTSSSQASVFSDASSASSSIATTISDDFRSTQDDREPDICRQLELQFRYEDPSVSHGPVVPDAAWAHKVRPSYANVTSVPAPHYTNPRRSSLCRAQKPPPLVRQRDRKVNFVDNLVDSATQMVEVIWPLSVVPCRAEAGGRSVLPLRTYIEETLKRSKTSYSTLQVALYYLVLIRPHVPENDFTMEQSVDCPAERALMCGRRMFLAALILASKYLQDRNYSAKAWSKMSGLKVCEINANERNFLSKINWKLHIPKPAFEKWQAIVLKYSPNAPPSPGSDVLCGSSTWKRMIKLLTPELDNLPIVESKLVENAASVPSYFDLSSPATPTPTRDAFKLPQIGSSSQETTPTPATVLPCLEPNPNLVPPMPTLARLGPLPTPIMTPQSVASSTPAASTYGFRRSSMCSAMAIAQKTGLNRCVMDGDYPHLTRRPSMMSTSSYYSSPESMTSDNSRSSRSSSISSVPTASSAMAPRACLARQATCRNAGLLSSRPIKEEQHIGCAMKPIIIDDDVEMVGSPMQADFSISEKALHAPHRHSRAPKQHSSQPMTASATEKSKKRGRPHGGHRRSELQEEVRYLLEESLDDDCMDVDDRITPPPAAEYASSLLNRGPSLVSYRDVQPAATLSGTWDYARVPVQKNDGKKRTCCSATRNMSMSISPVPLYGEVS